MLSPESLLRGEDSESKNRAMIKGTINECLKMRLLIEDVESGVIALNPELASESISKRKGDALLPLTLASLMITTENDANRYLALIVAWILTQDAYTPLGSRWADIEPLLRQQVGSDLLGMNNARYSQFVDWVCFLGFAWRHNLKDKDLITPDPTAYLRSSIKLVTEHRKSDAIALGDFISKLAAKCPVFETGAFRIEIEGRGEPRTSLQHLSSTTALALLRLKDEKVIRLTQRGDAPVFVFPEGDQIQSYSHLERV